MNYCEDIIKYLKKIKENLDNNLYCSAEKLEKDFITINKLTGIGTNTKKYKNLNDVFAVQEFLIKTS